MALEYNCRYREEEVQERRSGELVLRSETRSGDIKGAACEVENQENVVLQKILLRRCNQLSLAIDMSSKIRIEN